MSTGAKWAVGIAAAIAATYGCVVGHRALTKPSIEKVAKNFSEIFRRDVSKEEAQKLVGKYQELLKIEDTEEFITKAFEQVKKDYGYEKVPIKLEINKIKDVFGSGDAGWIKEDGVISINALINENGQVIHEAERGRRFLLENIIHEFQHAKQTEIAYRTSRDSLAEIIFNEKTNINKAINQIKHILSKKVKLETEANRLNITVEECKQKYERCLKKLEEAKVNCDKIKFNKNNPIALDDLFKDCSKFKEGSEEYTMGQKYLNNMKDYTLASIDRKGYEKQILEAEAYGAEKKFDKIYNTFNIWRIPWFM